MKQEYLDLSIINAYIMKYSIKYCGILNIQKNISNFNDYSFTKKLHLLSIFFEREYALEKDIFYKKSARSCRQMAIFLSSPVSELEEVSSYLSSINDRKEASNASRAN